MSVSFRPRSARLRHFKGTGRRALPSLETATRGLNTLTVARYLLEVARYFTAGNPAGQRTLQTAAKGGERTLPPRRPTSLLTLVRLSDACSSRRCLYYKPCCRWWDTNSASPATRIQGLRSPGLLKRGGANMRWARVFRRKVSSRRNLSIATGNQSCAALTTFVRHGGCKFCALSKV